jgi:signal transduction histidine kinase/PAS domain-containing protein
MEILEDPSGELTIDEVSSPAFDSRFVVSQVEVPNYGYTNRVYWVRLRLLNDTRLTRHWLLDLGFTQIHFVDLYIPLPDAGGFVEKHTGVLRSPASRDVRYPRIVFDVAIPAHSPQTLYLRFQNEASMTLPLTLWSQRAFLVQSDDELLRSGLYFGVMFALLIYNLFLLFSLREASYLFLTLFLANMIFFEATYAGYTEVYLITSLYYLKTYYQALSFALMLVLVLLFTDSFLEAKTRSLRLHRVIIAILGVWGALMLLTPFTNYHTIALLMMPWALVTLVAVFVAVIISWRGGFLPARFFMIAWLGLAVSLSITILVRLAAVTSTPVTEAIYRVGVIWMAASWSIALADRINVLKARTERASRELEASRNRLSQILEGLPLGVVVYGKDYRPSFINRRVDEILSNPAQGIAPDLSAGRTLAEAMKYYAFRVTGSDQDYALEDMPVYRAVRGEAASADDIEADLIDRHVPLEIWASPVRDAAGNVESAVVAFQDITERKKNEAELDRYRRQLEQRVDQRTAQLGAANERLQAEIGERKELEAMLRLRLEWLGAVSLVNQAVARSTDLAQICEEIIDIVNHLFTAENSFISELDEGGQNLKILAHSCYSERHAQLVGSRARLPVTVRSDLNLKRGQLRHFSKDELALLSGPLGAHLWENEIHSVALVPLILRERTFGFLGLEIQEEERTFTDDEIKLLAIFSLDIAQLIEGARLFEQTRALVAAEERNRLARDLHDSVTQVLFSATLVAEVLPQIFRRDPERALESLENLRRLTRGALAEMRTMLLELRPSALIKTPLGELLAQLTEAVTSRSGLPAQLFIEQIPSLPEEVHNSFYRIAQEALNNVVKHAQAQRVTVSLSATPVSDVPGAPRHEIKLVIQDDGVGFASENVRPGHLGIAIMRERAAAIQGSLELESRPGYGTQVTLIWRDEAGGTG